MQVTISDRCSFKVSAYQVHIDFEAPDNYCSFQTIQAINLSMAMN